MTFKDALEKGVKQAQENREGIFVFREKGLGKNVYQFEKELETFLKNPALHPSDVVAWISPDGEIYPAD